MSKNETRFHPLVLALRVALVSGLPLSVHAQQLIVVDGVTHTASGTYDSGNAADAYALAAAGKGSAIEGDGISAITGGARAFALAVQDYGVIGMARSTVKTTGSDAYGAEASGQGVISLDASQVTTTGTNAHGVVALDGGQVMLTNGSVNTAAGTGLAASGPGSVVTANGTKLGVTQAGAGNYGVVAQLGGTVNLGANTSLQYSSSAPGGNIGVYASGAGSAVHGTAFSLATSGDHVVGVQAQQGGLIDLNGGSKVVTAGSQAHALVSGNAGSVIHASDLDVTAKGEASDAVFASLDGKIELTNSTVTTQGLSSAIVLANQAGTVSLSKTVLKSTGASDGLLAYTGGVIAMEGGSVDAGVGFRIDGTGSRITTKDADITASRGGWIVSNGGTGSLDGGTVHVGFGMALNANGANSSIDVHNARIDTDGSPGYRGTGHGAAAYASQGASITLDSDTSVKINNARNNQVGMLAEGAGSAIALDGAHMDMSSQMPSFPSADGIDTYAVMALDGGQVALRKGAKVDFGVGNYFASGALYATGANSSISANDFAVTAGEMGIVVANGARADLSNGNVTVLGQDIYPTALTVSGDGSTITANHATINSLNTANAYGARVSQNGTVALNEGTVVTSSGVGISTGDILMPGGPVYTDHVTLKGATIKADTVGIVSIGNTVFDLANSVVEANQGPAIVLAGPKLADQLTVSGGNLSSTQDFAIRAGAADGQRLPILLKDGVQISGADGKLIYGGRNLDVTVERTALNGVMDAGGTGLNLALTDHSSLTGSVLYGGTSGDSLASTSSDAGWHITIDPVSTWTLSGDSQISSLNSSGAVVFAAPSGTTFKTLRILDDYHSNGGTISLNTVLNEGGPLSNQWTDRVLIRGNVSGTTLLTVNGTGSGASTDTNHDGIPDPNEGISLVQVLGQSSPTAFQLNGGYVAVGPWRYGLTAYDPSVTKDDQRVVDAGFQPAGSAKFSFWDYRLQSTLVQNADPTPGPTPDPSDTPENGQASGSSGGSDSGQSSSSPGGGSSRPGVVPQVPSYLSVSTAMLSYGMRSIGSFHDRLGEVHGDDGSRAGNTDEFYARVFGGNYSYHSDRSFGQYGYNFDQNDHGVQIGGTWLRADADASSFRLGLYGSTGTSHITPQSPDGYSAMRLSANSLAATGTYEHGSGFYVDGVAARNYYDTRVDTAMRGHDMTEFRTHGWSYSLESGYPFVVGDGLRVEPQVQAVYQALDTNTFHDADALSVQLRNPAAWVGRAGANLSKTFITASGQRWTPWMRANYLWSSGGRNDVTVGSDAWGVSHTFSSGDWGRAWQVGAGITGVLTPSISLYGNADYQKDAGNAGEEGWSANVGLRWQF